jgi:hypothetical protein
MSYTSSVLLRVITDGVTVTKSENITDEGVIKESVSSTSLNTPAVGSLSTRASDTAGTITDNDHTTLEGEVIDIYWDGGSAYGATVGTVTGTTIPFTGAAGDVMPTQDTAVTYCKQTDIDVAFDGDEMDTITQTFSTDGMATFYDSGDAALYNVDITSTTPAIWYNTSGVTRPITGNPVEKVSISNKTTAGDYQLIVLKNSI